MAFYCRQMLGKRKEESNLIGSPGQRLLDYGHRKGPVDEKADGDGVHVVPVADRGHDGARGYPGLVAGAAAAPEHLGGSQPV